MLKKIGIFIIGLGIVLAPMGIAYAKITPDCNQGTTVNDSQTGLGNACDFDYLITLINSIITFLLFKLATPIVGLILIYVGWLLITSGGSEEKKTKAKHIFFNVIVGYIIGLLAWLIVKWITSALGFTGETFLK